MPSIYTARWYIVLFALVLLICCIPFASDLTTPFKSIGFKDLRSESAKASQLLNKKLGYGYSNFIIIYTSKAPFSSHPEYLDEIKKSLSRLAQFSVKNTILYPSLENHQIAKDDHTAYAVVLVSSTKDIKENQLKQFKELISTPKHLTMKIGGEPIFLEDTQAQTERDLYKNEYIATPVALVTMLVVFGSVVAGVLPIILGGFAAFLILSLLYLLGHYFDLSVFTLNIALLLGAILTLDYSLLIISRFRDELKLGKDAKTAIADTQATAGKSVFYSGLVVLISLSGLLLFHVDVLFSVGMGGLSAVIVSMMVAIVLLPATLSILQGRINLLPIRFFKSTESDTFRWRWLLMQMEKRPWLFTPVLLVLLLALGYPFLHAKIGISDYRILPKGVESRDVFDIFQNKFGVNKLEPIYVIVQAKNKILEKNNIETLYHFVQELKKDKNIEEINSIVSLDTKMTKDQYQMMYTAGENRLPEELKNYLQVSTKDNYTIITITSKTDANSPQTKDLVEKLQKIKNYNTFKIYLTGSTAETLDVKKSILRTFPYVFLWIIVFTYLILLIFLRSVILPLKAIVTTMLSLCASYGVLVLVFQDGHLHQLLNFEKQGMVDITLLIIIFCALFGVSMDYEVFLLTRIKEFYDKTHDTITSIALGIERSSKIITSAAVIVILLCLAFMAADIIMVKAFGLGIAVAVFVDAFIIRILFVPAVMTLLGQWNWYIPAWLDRLLPKISES